MSTTLCELACLHLLPSLNKGYEGEVFKSITDMIVTGQIETVIVEIKYYIEMLTKIQFLNLAIEHEYKVYAYPEKYGTPVTEYANLSWRWRFSSRSPFGRFDHDVTKCITEVRQIVKQMPLAASSQGIFHGEDYLITKKEIPASWRIIRLNDNSVSP